MLYLGIDQHRKQLTVDLRNEDGDSLLRRQVSTRWKPVRNFFGALAVRAAEHGGLLAVVEVCGFNDWLLKLLKEYECVETIVIQAEKRSKKKTDRRDAAQLAELLWINRDRIRRGDRIRGLRRVHLVGRRDAENRQLTSLHRRLTQWRTRTINKIQHLLLKHNLQQECPTKGLQTKAARAWLAALPLEEIDRLEMDQLLDQWKLWDKQLAELDVRIARRQQADATATIIATVPGAGAFSSLALASRIGPIERFPTPASLSNYWGLTPGCRNSGDATKRLGSITKEGSSLARYVLGQMVLHVLRRDPAMKSWYLRIKKRRGAKIARVAVMRRLAVILWHMVKHQRPYAIGGPAELERIKRLKAEPAA